MISPALLIAKGIDKGDVKAALVAGIHQEGRAALASAAEMEIEAGDDAAGRKILDQYPVDEVVGAELGELAGEMTLDHGIKT